MPRTAATSNAWLILVLVLLPVIAHAPALMNWISVNPIYWESRLAPTQPPPAFLLRGFPGWVDGNAGVTTQALGRLAAEDWLHGIVPWWNPYSGVGLPLAAEMQCSALFLPFVLLLHFDNGVLYLKICMQILAGLATLALLRQLGIGRLAALTGAVLAECNGTFAWFSHGPIMPVAFLPLLLLGIERSRAHAETGRRGGWVLIAVAIAYSILAGFPETAFLNGLLGLAVAAYRVVQFGPGRVHLARKIILGGSVGLLLSAPCWLAFLEFLPHAYLSVHADYSHFALLPSSYAMLLLPYTFGPLLYGPEMIGQQADLWWHSDGYCDLFLLFLAVCALLRRPGRDGGFRWLLAGWCTITLARAGGLPVVSGLLNYIPFIKQSAFHLYITPSWEFCLIILASWTIEDWHRDGKLPGRRISLAAALCTFAAALVLWLGRHDIMLLTRQVHGGWLFAAAGTCLALAVIFIAACLLSGLPARCRRLSLFGIIAANCLILFTVPLFSGTRDQRLELGVVEFLQGRLGLSRFYSMGTFWPNYGAYFQLASVNHNYSPVAQNWVDYIHAHLNPAMDGVTFNGTALIPGLDADVSAVPAISASDALRTYAALGVRYIVTRPGDHPFADIVGPVVGSSVKTALALDDGARISLSYPAAQFRDGVANRVGIYIGTYLGAAQGRLNLSVCAMDRCAQGSAEVDHATDNAVLWVDLDRPIALQAIRPLTVRITYEKAASPVAVWLWPARAGGPLVDVDGKRGSQAPSILFRYDVADPVPVPVYQDAYYAVYELTQAARYFSAAGGKCILHAQSRQILAADCAAPDRLIRRELYFPGWTARRDGGRVDITSYDSIFQSVDLPAGHSVYRFWYEPPGIYWAYGAMVMGLFALAGACRPRAWVA